MIGIGKRIGKTAVDGACRARCSRATAVSSVVAMGRGGPAEPELVETPPTIDDLVALARAGSTRRPTISRLAVLAGVPTVGCRRAGGGIAGAPFVSNVARGRAPGRELEPDVVVFDGSGAAHRRRRRRRRCARILGNGPRARLRASGSATSSLDELVLASSAADRAARRAASPCSRRPGADGPPRRRTSRNLATATCCARAGDVDAEVYLVELKAAAIDVVAETRSRRASSSPRTRSSRRARGGLRPGEALRAEPRRIMPPAGGGELGRRTRAADGALAHGGRRRRTARMRSRQRDLAERGQDRAPARELAVEDSRGRARARLRRYQLRAARHPRRRRDGHGQVHGRDRDRVQASGSRGSPRPTRSGRRCARSSRTSSCRRSTTRASRPAAPCPTPTTR